MKFRQMVTVAVNLLLLSVSNGTVKKLYFGLMIGVHKDGGAKMGVKNALKHINLHTDYELA